MNDQLTVLTPVNLDGTPSTRRMNKYIYTDGTYDFGGNHLAFSVKSYDFANLHNFFEVMEVLTKGTQKIIIRGLYIGASPHCTRRQNMHFQSLFHRIICLDIDETEAPAGVEPTSIEAVEHVIQLLPNEFHDTDYVVQFSSSAGVKGQYVKAHIWFWLEDAVTDDVLKKWAKSTSGLVDYRLFQKVQIHFICDPTFQSPSMDKFAGKPRLIYQKKSRETVPLSFLKNTPAPSKGYIGRAGGIHPNNAEQFPAIILDQNGKAIDGREDLHLKIRFHLMQSGYTNFEKFCTDVWAQFGTKAELGPTEHSETNWNLELSNLKCQQDKDKLAMYVGGKVIIPKTHMERGVAQQQLTAAVLRFFAEKKDTAIKAAAGLGKSKGVRDVIASLPSPSIEYYVPTKLLAHECAQEFDANLDVRVFEGRHEGNCQKFELAKRIGELGGGVTHKLCHNKSGKSCEFWGTCKWSTQNPDSKPAIRIMAHKYLSLQRPEHFPKPDFVIVDESILSEIISEWKNSANRIWSMDNINRLSQHVHGSGPITKKHPTEEITADEWDDLYEVGQIIRNACMRNTPLLQELRSKGYTRDDLLRCSEVVNAFTPFLNVNPTMTSAQMDLQMGKCDRRGIKSIRWLSKFYKLLAQEIELDRDDPRGIQFVDADCVLLYRNDLPRIEGIPTIFLDADLESSILTSIKEEIETINLDVEYNADVYKVTDRAFSKSELGLVSNEHNANKIAEIKAFISNLKNPETTLVITYIELQEILTGERKGFTKMECGAIVGHFGNIRGIDTFKDFETAVVIGRNRPPTYVIGQKLRALTHDIDQEDYSELNSAIYRAMVTSETNQAVARLRMIWCDSKKTVYLLSNEDVPFAAHHELRWDELRSGGGRLHKLLDRFGAFPLTASWLHKTEPDLFATNKAAEKWIANNHPVGTETGRYRSKGKGGPHPSRFLADQGELDPLKRLEKNLCTSLTKYEGPERGIIMQGKVMRELPRHPEIQPLVAMGLISGQRLPEP